MDRMAMRGLAISRHGSMAKFAKHIGWSDRKTQDILRKRQVPVAKDIEVLVIAFEFTDPQEFVDYFTQQYHNVADRPCHREEACMIKTIATPHKAWMISEGGYDNVE